MIKLKQIASNMTVLRRNEDEILFSYETPVAIYDSKNLQYFKTDRKWSATTSRHITKWLDGVEAKPVPQSFIDSFVKGQEMDANDSINTVVSRKRQAQVEAGMYDGRYNTKVVSDKRKKVSKDACRDFKFQTYIEG